MGILTRLIDWLWPKPGPEPDPDPNPPDPGLVTLLVNAHNSERSQRGLGKLQRHKGLDASAQQWAAQMARTGRLAHGDVAGRLDDAGVRWSSYGENIAYGYDTVTAVMQGWMGSRGHRANILNPSFNAIGIGIATTPGGTIYWCVDFARLSNQLPPATAAVTSDMSALAEHRGHDPIT